MAVHSGDNNQLIKDPEVHITKTVQGPEINNSYENRGKGGGSGFWLGCFVGSVAATAVIIATGGFGTPAAAAVGGACATGVKALTAAKAAAAAKSVALAAACT